MSTNKQNVSANVSRYLQGKHWFLTQGHRSTLQYIKARILWDDKLELSQDIDDVVKISDINREGYKITQFFEKHPPTPTDEFLTELYGLSTTHFDTAEEVQSEAWRIWLKKSADMDFKGIRSNTEQYKEISTLIANIRNHRQAKIKLIVSEEQTIEILLPTLISTIRSTIELTHEEKSKISTTTDKKLRIQNEINEYLDNKITLAELELFIKRTDAWGFHRFFSFSSKINRSLAVIRGLEKNKNYQKFDRKSKPKAGFVPLEAHEKIIHDQTTAHNKTMADTDAYLGQVIKERDVLKRIEDDRNAKKEALEKMFNDPVLSLNAREEQIDEMWSECNIPQDLFINTMRQMLSKLNAHSQAFIVQLDQSTMNGNESEEISLIIQRVEKNTAEISAYIQKNIDGATNETVQYQTSCAGVWKFLNQSRHVHEYTDPTTGNQEFITEEEEAYHSVMYPALKDVMSKIQRKPVAAPNHPGSVDTVIEAIKSLIKDNEQMTIALNKDAQTFKGIYQFTLSNNITTFVNGPVAEQQEYLRDKLRLLQGHGQTRGYKREEFNVLSRTKEDWQNKICEVASHIIYLPNKLVETRAALFTNTLAKGQQFAVDANQPRIFIPTSPINGLTAQDFTKQYYSLHAPMGQSGVSPRLLDSYAILNNKLAPGSTITPAILKTFKEGMEELFKDLSPTDRERWTTFVKEMARIEMSTLPNREMLLASTFNKWEIVPKPDTTYTPRELASHNGMEDKREGQAEESLKENYTGNVANEGFFGSRKESQPQPEINNRETHSKQYSSDNNSEGKTSNDNKDGVNEFKPTR
ncbi:MAG: hypothetical protein Q8R24_07275 [Legionellaceae bacterium]|nr:hypothetical protein [Legionellaceae bacterium]